MKPILFVLAALSLTGPVLAAHDFSRVGCMPLVEPDADGVDCRKGFEHPGVPGFGVPNGTCLADHRGHVLRVTQSGATKDALKDGPWIATYADGKVAARGNYINGKRSGRWEFFWNEGAKMSEGEYRNGKPHGLWKGWFTDGSLAEEAHFSDGVRDGTWVGFWAKTKDDLIVRYQRVFDQGKPTGVWMTFRPDGTVSAHFQFIEHQMTLAAYYWAEGEKGEFAESSVSGPRYAAVGRCKEGRQIGLWKLYGPDGKTVMEKQF